MISKNFQSLAKVPPASYSNFILRVHENNLMEDTILRTKTTSKKIWNLNGKLWAFCKIILHCRQNCTLRLQKIFLKEVYIFQSSILSNNWELRDRTFQSFREKIWQMGENCILRLQKNILRIYVLLRKKILL